MIARCGYRPNNANVYNLVLKLFAEDHGLDGCWWSDRLDVPRLSAPRGVIAVSRLATWCVESTDEMCCDPARRDRCTELSHTHHSRAAVSTTSVTRAHLSFQVERSTRHDFCTLSYTPTGGSARR